MSRGRPPLRIGQHGLITAKVTGREAAVAHCRVRDQDGVVRQLRVTGRSKADAVAKLQERLGERVPSDSGDITADSKLSDLAALWLSELADSDRSTNTRQRYAEVTTAYIVKPLGAVRVREATVGLLQRHLRTVAEGTGRATAKLVRANLSAMFKIAVAHGAVTRNPMTDVTTPAPKHAEVTALTVEEAVDIRRIIREDDVAVRQDLPDSVDVLLGTGVRLGELLALRWCDLDLGAEVPSLIVTGTVVRVRGVGLVRQEHPKSASGRRRLHLPEFAVSVLMARSVAAEANAADLVFPSSVGTLRDPMNFGTAWRACRNRHGWGEITPKSFRKSVATLLADDAMETAQAQLGHGSSEVTSRHYVQRTHTTPDSRDKLAAFGG